MFFRKIKIGNDEIVVLSELHLPELMQRTALVKLK